MTFLEKLIFSDNEFLKSIKEIKFHKQQIITLFKQESFSKAGNTLQKFEYIVQINKNSMHKLNSQDVFFLKMKFQRSINLPKSPRNENKISFPQTNFQKSQDTHVKRQINVNETNKKISTDQDLNNWLFKKQLKLKTFFDRKNQQQKGDYFLIAFSDDIKFRDQQDWLELKHIAQSKKSSMHQNEINHQNNDPSKSKQNMKKRSLRIQNPSSGNQFQTLLKFDSNNFNALKDTKLNQKIDYLCQKTIQALLRKKTENDEPQLIRLSPRYPKKNQKKTSNQRDSNLIHSPNKNKPQIKLLMTTDSSPKKVLAPWKNCTLLQCSQPIKRYKNRQISPTQKQELKSEYHQLDKRLNSLLMSTKQERTLQA